LISAFSLTDLISDFDLRGLGNFWFLLCWIQITSLVLVINHNTVKSYLFSRNHISVLSEKWKWKWKAFDLFLHRNQSSTPKQSLVFFYFRTPEPIAQKKKGNPKIQKKKKTTQIVEKSTQHDESFWEWFSSQW
jgi:hypothetical protein